jgi:uncharacterized damage-inducible protein DinB
LAPPEEVMKEWNAAFQAALGRLLKFSEDTLNRPCGVGQKQLQTTVGAVLIHVAEHSQRHVGQIITTAKTVMRYTFDGESQGD